MHVHMCLYVYIHIHIIYTYDHCICLCTIYVYCSAHINMHKSFGLAQNFIWVVLSDVTENLEQIFGSTQYISDLVTSFNHVESVCLSLSLHINLIGMVQSIIIFTLIILFFQPLNRKHIWERASVTWVSLEWPA